MDVTSELVLAIDGGNSKTEAIVARGDGTIVRRTRGGGFRPQLDGIDVAMNVLSLVVGPLLTDRIALVSACLAGADLPEEVDVLYDRLTATGWGERVSVANDTVALLRSGAPERWGVAVVCGAGINAVGIAPDGATANFPALGQLTGDWGGGAGLARTALWSAVRGEDGRGTRTALSGAIADHFGRVSALDVGLSVHRGGLSPTRLDEIAPLLFAVAATGDAVAVEIVDRLALEVTSMAAVLIERLGLGDRDVPLVLGGGVLRARHPQLDEALAKQIAAQSLRVVQRIPALPPVVGAVLLALDELGAPSSAEQRLLTPT